MAQALSEVAINSPTVLSTTDATQTSSGQRTRLALGALAVLVAALILHLAWIDRVPANLNPDEADTLTTYLLAKYTGYPALLGFNWNGAPALNAYLTGWGWELGGRGMGGVRIASALLSALTCSLFFLLIYLYTRRLALALGLTLLLAANPWFLNFARSGWENAWNTLTALVILLGFYLLYEQTDAAPSSVWGWQRWGLGLLIGGAAAAFYFYHPGKLFMAAVLLILLLGQLLPRYRLRFGLIAAFALSAGLLITPQLVPMLCTNIALHEQMPALQRLTIPACTVVNQRLLRMPAHGKLPIKIQADGWDRVSKVSIFDQEKPWQLLQASVVKNARGFTFFARSDFDAPLNNRYIPRNDAPIPLAIAFLYLLGLLLAFVEYPYIALFYLFVLLPPELLSVRTPDAARAVHIVPLIFLFAGFALDRLLTLSRRAAPGLNRLVYPLLLVALVALALQQGAVYRQWITSPAALRARQPAVAAAQYPAWLEGVIKRIEGVTPPAPPR